MDLHKAALNGNLACVRMFLEQQGADKDKGDSRDGDTPLRMASINGHLHVVQYLVELHASLDKANNDGYTPLSVAVYFGHLDVVRYLLEQGADRDLADKEGWTPLHLASRWGHLEIAILLMNYGADLNAKNKWDELPIDVADGEEMKQAIRDEPRRRMDHGYKRATEQDMDSYVGTTQQEEVEMEGEEQGDEEGQRDKRLRVCEDVVVVSDNMMMVAEEDEDSESSDDEEEE